MPVDFETRMLPTISHWPAETMLKFDVSCVIRTEASDDVHSTEGVEEETSMAAIENDLFVSDRDAM